MAENMDGLASKVCDPVYLAIFEQDLKERRQ